MCFRGGPLLTTVAYIANEFPSPIEPYVMDEIGELRRRGIRVICCSGKKIELDGLNDAERRFREESFAFHPLPWLEFVRAARRLAFNPKRVGQLAASLRKEKAGRRIALHHMGHTMLGAALAEQLAAFNVKHIHAHHGYFASWMALVAAELLGIGFSFTLHGSDLLMEQADLLATKLERCSFCVTVSNFNRDFILEHYPSTAAAKVMVQRLGVDPIPSPGAVLPKSDQRRTQLLSVGRLHSVKNHRFLIDACTALRDEGHDFVCWIAGEGPERPALEHQIEQRQLQGYIVLLGMVPRDELSWYYQLADLLVLTSRSEGIPVTLMEAMAHRRLTLAPAITGIPELVENGHTGFLYEPDSMPDFLRNVRRILAEKDSLEHVRQAAAQHIADSYDRQRNLQQFADQFLSRIGHMKEQHAHSLLQQVQLSI